MDHTDPSTHPKALKRTGEVQVNEARGVRREILASARDGDMKGVLEKSEEAVEAGADPAALLRDLYGDLRDAAVEAARAAKGEALFSVEWCLAAAELVQGQLWRGTRSHASRAVLDLSLLSIARLGDVRDLEELVERLERLGEGRGPPAPRPSPPPAETGLAADYRTRLAPRGSGASPPPAPQALELESHDAENRGRRAEGSALSSEELKRVRSMPMVRRVLETFGGQIEHVRRSNG